MTNDEIAVLIQQGHEDLYLQLWNQVRGFVALMAIRRFLYTDDRKAADIEDLIQAGFIGMTNAVKTYDADKGRFLNHLRYHIRTEFNEALGCRTKRDALDPIHGAASLDEPLSDDDGDTILDTVAYPGDPIEDAEENIYREQLRAAIERVLEEIPKRSADVIRSTLLDGEPISQVAERYGTTEKRLRSRRDGYLCELKSAIERTGAGKVLRDYIEENTRYYMKIGRDEFNRTHTSVPERLAIIRETMEQNFLKRLLRTGPSEKNNPSPLSSARSRDTGGTISGENGRPLNRKQSN